MTLLKFYSENYNTKKGILYLISAESIGLRIFFDCAEVFPKNLQHKGLFYFQKNALWL